ncbi:hypothetical protein KP509_07G074100 [Ceratopteris richardii]|uniref:Sm protein B n=1 Tax=Ceratopteris richardii TaxID=49495 RepID=A0A8T2UFV3_CERRI|nr:hypothetical protein KP509_07G074100 [Ceratopteris richardii]
MSSRGSKMLQYINYRMRVTIQDGRQMVGKLMAFDRHMNLVLGDCEEFRRLPPKAGMPKEEREDRRTLGLVLLRGEEVVSMIPEGPMIQDDARGRQAASAQPGPGTGRAVGRGIPTAPLVQAQPGLAGPVRGVGGPSPGMMQPQVLRPPVPQVSAGPVTYPAPVSSGPMPGVRPPAGFPIPGQSPAPGMMQPPPGTGMRPPPMNVPSYQQNPPRPGMPPPPMSGMPPPSFTQRPPMGPPQMVRGPPSNMGAPPRPGMPVPPPPSVPPRPVMPPPSGPPMYGAPRPGMPPPPPQHQQQQQQPPQQ